MSTAPGASGWFDFGGRIGRVQFLLRHVIAGWLPWVLLGWAIAAGGELPWLLTAAGFIAAVFVTLAAYVDRLRDMDAPPWLIILMFVPLFNFGLFIACVFIPGKVNSRA